MMIFIYDYKVLLLNATEVFRIIVMFSHSSYIFVLILLIL